TRPEKPWSMSVDDLPKQPTNQGEIMNARSISRSTRRSAAAALQQLIEQLEQRRLLAIITVTGIGDTIAVDGKVTLREAITSTNNNADLNADVTAHHSGGVYLSSPMADTISFNIAGAGVHEIDLASALPAVLGPVLIDGYSQPA